MLSGHGTSHAVESKPFSLNTAANLGLLDPRRLAFAHNLTKSGSDEYLPSVSRPDGRSGKCRKAAGEESPGSMETRCRVTPGGGDPRESATESKPPRQPRPVG